MAFPSNSKAIDAFIKSKSDYWSILDSFSLSLSHPEKSHLKPNYLSNILVDVIRENIDYIADRWVKDVKTNKSTLTYHKMSDSHLKKRFIDDTNYYIKWLTADLEMEQMENHYRRLGTVRKKEGFKQYELISALSLIRKYIWEFALSKGMWNKTIDIYRTLELERRMMLFFDKVSYHVSHGYEEPVA